MIGLVIALAAAAVCAVVYFFLTAGSRPREDGAWLTGWRYAHRGLHDEARPENTIPAFSAAIKHGYGIELDVHLSRDGRLVVFHDDRLARVTGRTGRVEDYTAEELQTFAVCGTQYTIPLLADVLRETAGRVPLLIETKNEGAAGELEVKLYQAMRDYPGRYAVQSFSPFSMGWFKKHAPDVLRGQLSCDFSMGAEHIARVKRFAVRHLLTNALCRPHFISYEVNGIHTNVVQRLRRRGVPALCWTVRSEKTAEEMGAFADTIIFEGFCPGQGER